LTPGIGVRIPAPQPRKIALGLKKENILTTKKILFMNRLDTNKSEI